MHVLCTPVCVCVFALPADGVFSAVFIVILPKTGNCDGGRGGRELPVW